MSREKGSLDSESAQGKERKVDKLRRHAEDEDLKEILALPAGRRVFWRIVDEFGGLTSVTGFGSPSDDVMRHEGGRGVAARLLTEGLRVNAGAVQTGYAEAMATRAKDQIVREAARRDQEAAPGPLPGVAPRPDGLE